MNEISNFNSTNLGPDPIKKNFENKPNIPAVKVPKKNSNGAVFTFLAIIVSLFLIVFSVSIIFDIVTKSQGEGEVITNEEKGNISVNSQSSIYVSPDAAQVSFGIVTESKTMEEAMNENTRKSTNIKNYIQGQGVLADNIKTIGLEVDPQYQKQTVGVDETQYPEGRIVIVGYKVTETIQVKIANVNNVGKVIQEGLDSGASTVSDLMFIVENNEQYLAEARADAIKKAEVEAKQIANNLGVQLGSPISYSDSNYGDVYRASSNSLLEANVSLGQNEIVVNTYIVYSIK